MNDLIRLLICFIIAIIIAAIILHYKKTPWYKYKIKADVMEGPMTRSNSSIVHHLEEECYFPFKIKTEKDVRKAERVLTRRYRTKVVKITEYKLTGTTLW